MNESEINLFATVAAMKLLLGRLYSLTYDNAGWTPEAVAAAHEALFQKMQTQTLVRSSDPAISDVMSDEVAQEMERFLRGVEKDFRRMKQTT
jgi:hypothetical protein